MNRFKKVYCRAFQTAFKLALPFLPYRQPEVLQSLSEIPALFEKRKIHSVMLVTDRDIRKLGLTKGLEAALQQRKIACCVYDETVPNPTIDNVEAARALYLANGAQAIIAFGGGSSMDCAKAAGARIVKPGQSVGQMKGLLHVHRRLPLLVAVPTTAGTGSETTLAAVITDSQTHHKYPINDFSLIPHVAVLDYTVTLGLPKQITATTGMDALTHAVEAYIGRSTTKQTRQMAERATVLIHDNLLRAYQNGADAEARQNMLYAAYCAGVAFTKSYVGYVHAVAHSLGGQYRIPHGLANAVILPYFLKAYGAACHRPLARLARLTHLATEQDTEADAAGKFIAWVEQMNEAMGIPKTIDKIEPKDIPVMARYADQEGNPLYPVPKLMDRQELAQMYEHIRTKEEPV